MPKLAQMSKELSDVQLVVSELVGEHAIPIIDFLTGKEKISEFIIAEELEMEINEVRNILYLLLEHNIVRFLRKKDRIKGWYICYWDFNDHMVPHLKFKILENKLENLHNRLTAESAGQYYICTRACMRATFDEAMEMNFKCAECGIILQEQDNTRTKEFLSERIAELEKQLNKAKPKKRKVKASA
ncbi:MAG: hypothetical protein OXR66_07040 [Candidatus Woesearchaeota archaeon]|nr:hypothetical protein [Candidatus Woesearchaeota archaeon]